MSARARLSLGLLVGVAMLWLVGRSVDWSAALTALRRTSAIDSSLALASILAYVVAKAVRWRWLVSPFAATSARQLLPAVFAGNAGNSLIPHAGELARVFVAKRVVAAPASALVATIAVERVLDFMALLILAMLVLVPLGAMTDQTRTAAIIVGTIGAVVLVAALIVSVRTERCLVLAESGMGRLRPALRERILREARVGAEGLASLRHPRLVATVLVFSLVQWLLVAATIFFSLRSVNVDAGAAGVTAALLLSVVGMTLPTAPGYVGTTQAAFVLALAPFGVAVADSVAASLIYNFFIVVPAWVIGLPQLRQVGLPRPAASSST